MKILFTANFSVFTRLFGSFSLNLKKHLEISNVPSSCGFWSIELLDEENFEQCLLPQEQKVYPEKKIKKQYYKTNRYFAFHSESK